MCQIWFKNYQPFGKICQKTSRGFFLTHTVGPMPCSHAALTSTGRRRSSVNFGGGARHVCPKIVYEIFFKKPEFYVIFARKMPEFYMIIALKYIFRIFFFFGGGRGTCPLAPDVSYVYASTSICHVSLPCPVYERRRLYERTVDTGLCPPLCGLFLPGSSWSIV